VLFSEAKVTLVRDIRPGDGLQAARP
jgi:hypothetical protein